jgi:hypothetical protein
MSTHRTLKLLDEGWDKRIRELEVKMAGGALPPKAFREHVGRRKELLEQRETLKNQMKKWAEQGELD